MKRLVRSLRNYRSFRRLCRGLFSWQIKLRVTAEPNMSIGEQDGSPALAHKERLLVAEWLGQEVGSVCLQYLRGPDKADRGWWIYDLKVRGPCRGLGIGEKLMLDQITWVREQGFSLVRLYAFQEDVPSMMLYGKLGFEGVLVPVIEERLEKEALARGQRRILLQKRIGGK